MLYAISDIHGCYRELYSKADQMGNLAPFENGDNKLVLLGDYIDRGAESRKVLEMVFSWQETLGTDTVIVLRGNHEDWFLDFLDGIADEWLTEDEGLNTSKTFLHKGQLDAIKKDIAVNGNRNIRKIYSYIRTCIKNNYPELITWLRNLPYYYETENQIFVHAGVDEEAEDLWKLGTPEYVFTGKFPATLGSFYKDVIAGHISTATIAGNEDFNGIYYDGKSHFYIDGSVETTGNLLVLAYDEQSKTYYSLEPEDKHLVTRATRLKVRGELIPIK